MRVEDALHGSSRYTGSVGAKGRDGYGVMKYANGEAYIGEWRQGRREGEGVYFYSDGTVYDGAWAEDSAHGVGLCRYPTGNVYHGEWHAGKVNGHGTMFYADGDTYDGEWREGHLHGRGAFFNRDGDVHQGRWFEDQVLDDETSPLDPQVPIASHFDQIERKRTLVAARCATLEKVTDRLAHYMSTSMLDELHGALDGTHSPQQRHVLHTPPSLLDTRSQTPLSETPARAARAPPTLNGGLYTAEAVLTQPTVVATTPAEAAVLAAAAAQLVVPPPSHATLANGHVDPIVSTNPLTRQEEEEEEEEEHGAEKVDMVFSPTNESTARESSPDRTGDNPCGTFHEEGIHEVLSDPGVLSEGAETAPMPKNGSWSGAVAGRRASGVFRSPSNTIPEATSLPDVSLPPALSQSAESPLLLPRTETSPQGGRGTRKRDFGSVASRSSVSCESQEGNPWRKNSSRAGFDRSRTRSGPKRRSRDSQMVIALPDSDGSPSTRPAEWNGLGYRKRPSTSDEDEDLRKRNVSKRRGRARDEVDIEIDLDDDPVYEDGQNCGSSSAGHTEVSTSTTDSSDFESAASAEPPDEGVREEEYKKLKAIFDRLQHEHAEKGATLTNADVQRYFENDAEVREVTKELRKETVKGWFKLIARGDPEQAAEWDRLYLSQQELERNYRNKWNEKIAAQRKQSMGRLKPQQRALAADPDAEREGFNASMNHAVNIEIDLHEEKTVACIAEGGVALVGGRRVGGATAFAVWSALLPERKQMLSTLRLKSQRKTELGRRRSLHHGHAHEDDASDFGSIPPEHSDENGSVDGGSRTGPQSPAGDQGDDSDSPTMKLWSRLGQVPRSIANTVSAGAAAVYSALSAPFRRQPPPPHGAMERAKGIESVFAKCGPSREPFSLQRYLAVFLMMLFPFPFVFLRSSATEQERQYVVSGAEPRFVQRPGHPDLYVGIIVVPLLVVMIVYASSNDVGEVPGGSDRAGLLSAADVAVPIVAYVLLALTSAAFTAYPRRKAHFLETLPDTQFNLLASFTYSKLKPKIGGDWAVTWCSPGWRPEGGMSQLQRCGDFVMTWSYRHLLFSFVIAVLFALAMPLHRLLEDGTMWGSSRGARIVTGLGAAVTFLSCFAIFHLLSRVLRLQQQLVQQLAELTNLTEVSIEEDIVLAAPSDKFVFDLSNTGLTESSRFQSTHFSQLKTLLGWYLCRSFILYGSPVMNHSGHTAVMNCQVFMLLCVSITLIVAFVYDATAAGDGADVKHTNRVYTVATLCLICFAPLLALHMRLWYRVTYFYKVHHGLLSSAATCKRVQVLRAPAPGPEGSIPEGAYSHDQEAHLVKGVADFVRDSDYKPRRLGYRSMLLFVLLLVLALGSLAQRWVQEFQSDNTTPIANETNVTSAPVAVLEMISQTASATSG